MNLKHYTPIISDCQLSICGKEQVVRKKKLRHTVFTIRLQHGRAAVINTV